MKFLHTMLRVGDMQRPSTSTLQPWHARAAHARCAEYKYSLTFLASATAMPMAAPSSSSPITMVLPHEQGTAFGHLALGVPDVAAPASASRTLAAGPARPAR
jgi:lactoylglutathione lyase